MSKLVAIVKHEVPCLPFSLNDYEYNAPSVTGPKGGHLKLYAQAYAACEVPPNYPMPAIPLELVFTALDGKLDGCELVCIHPVDDGWNVVAEYNR